MRTFIVAAALLLHAMPADAQRAATKAVTTRPAVDTTRIISRSMTVVALVPVPSVIGLSLNEAQKAFGAVKLRSTAVRLDRGTATPDDIVLRQSPAAGQRVVVATLCTLYVRPPLQTGRDTPSVVDRSVQDTTREIDRSVQLTPRVIGLSLTEAVRRIRIAELTPNITTVPSPDTALGSVIRQEPRPRTPIRRDRTIDLQVAGVPQVVGLPADAAMATLERAHLAATTAIREVSAGNDGTVLEQSPPAGRLAEPGSSVALLVMHVVEPPFAMPDLVGRPLDDARRFLTRAGLSLRGVEIASAEGRPDTVVGQSPAARAIVRRGDEVILTGGRPITTVVSPPRVKVDTAVPPPLVAVPDFVGIRIGRVSSVPRAKLFRISTRYLAPTPDAADSVVAAQSLASGSRVSAGSAITLTVSQRQAVRMMSLRIEPDSVSIVPHDSVQLTGIGVMSDGSRIAVTPSWAATMGSVTLDGRYIAAGETGRAIVAAAYRGLATTSIVRVERPPTPWWLIAAIAVAVAGLSVGAWLYWHRPPPPPPPSPPPPVPPLAFTYDLDAPSIETEITATAGHGSNLSLVSYAGESVQAIEPVGVQLFDEENTHG